ncbi:unnamed protein product [Rangifer tarandus platyrhynchus]|uniref:Uncharacterized protein n=2 Tax=Rangifer tarandus platyrhynchus TaxID=3082113 RepID=A0ACB0F6S7_RANTA|nr:unnamed protein product [Rangifer tarandus platyrhynchus]CAI9708354.1 unnamed protein product [Rangifer tarandus platyrhynchus]
MRNRVRLLEGGSKGQSSAEPARWRRSHIPSARRLEPVHVALFRDPISAGGGEGAWGPAPSSQSTPPPALCPAGGSEGGAPSGRRAGPRRRREFWMGSAAASVCSQPPPAAGLSHPLWAEGSGNSLCPDRQQRRNCSLRLRLEGARAAGLRASRIPSWFWLSPARPRPIWLQPHCIQLPFTLTSDVNPRPQQGLRLSAFLTRAGQNSPDTQAKAVSHPDRVSRWNSCPASAPTEAGSPGLSRPGLCRPQGLAGTQESAFRTAYMTVK